MRTTGSLDRLILPGIVTDVSEAAAADPDYLVTPEDVVTWEDEHGRVGLSPVTSLPLPGSSLEDE